MVVDVVHRVAREFGLAQPSHLGFLAQLQSANCTLKSAGLPGTQLSPEVGRNSAPTHAEPTTRSARAIGRPHIGAERGPAD